MSKNTTIPDKNIEYIPLYEINIKIIKYLSYINTINNYLSIFNYIFTDNPIINKIKNIQEDNDYIFYKKNINKPTPNILSQTNLRPQTPIIRQNQPLSGGILRPPTQQLSVSPTQQSSISQPIGIQSFAPQLTGPQPIRQPIGPRMRQISPTSIQQSSVQQPVIPPIQQLSVPRQVRPPTQQSSISQPIGIQSSAPQLTGPRPVRPPPTQQPVRPPVRQQTGPRLRQISPKPIDNTIHIQRLDNTMEQYCKKINDMIDKYMESNMYQLYELYYLKYIEDIINDDDNTLIYKIFANYIMKLNIPFGINFKKEEEDITYSKNNFFITNQLYVFEFEKTLKIEYKYKNNIYIDKNDILTNNICNVNNYLYNDMINHINDWSSFNDKYNYINIYYQLTNNISDEQNDTIFYNHSSINDDILHIGDDKIKESLIQFVNIVKTNIINDFYNYKQICNIALIIGYYLVNYDNITFIYNTKIDYDFKNKLYEKIIDLYNDNVNNVNTDFEDMIILFLSYVILSFIINDHIFINYDKNFLMFIENSQIRCKNIIHEYEKNTEDTDMYLVSINNESIQNDKLSKKNNELNVIIAFNIFNKIYVQLINKTNFKFFNLINSYFDKNLVTDKINKLYKIENNVTSNTLSEYIVDDITIENKIIDIRNDKINLISQTEIIYKNISQIEYKYTYTLYGTDIILYFNNQQTNENLIKNLNDIKYITKNINGILYIQQPFIDFIPSLPIFITTNYIFWQSKTEIYCQPLINHQYPDIQINFNSGINIIRKDTSERLLLYNEINNHLYLHKILSVLYKISNNISIWEKNNVYNIYIHDFNIIFTHNNGITKYKDYVIIIDYIYKFSKWVNMTNTILLRDNDGNYKILLFYTNINISDTNSLWDIQNFHKSDNNKFNNEILHINDSKYDKIGIIDINYTGNYITAKNSRDAFAYFIYLLISKNLLLVTKIFNYTLSHIQSYFDSQSEYILNLSKEKIYQQIKIAYDIPFWSYFITKIQHNINTQFFKFYFFNEASIHYDKKKNFFPKLYKIPHIYDTNIMLQNMTEYNIQNKVNELHIRTIINIENIILNKIADKSFTDISNDKTYTQYSFIKTLQHGFKHDMNYYEIIMNDKIIRESITVNDKNNLLVQIFLNSNFSYSTIISVLKTDPFVDVNNFEKYALYVMQKIYNIRFFYNHYYTTIHYFIPNEIVERNIKKIDLYKYKYDNIIQHKISKIDCNRKQIIIGKTHTIENIFAFFLSFIQKIPRNVNLSDEQKKKYVNNTHIIFVPETITKDMLSKLYFNVIICYKFLINKTKESNKKEHTLKYVLLKEYYNEMIDELLSSNNVNCTKYDLLIVYYIYKKKFHEIIVLLEKILLNHKITPSNINNIDNDSINFDDIHYQLTFSDNEIILDDTDKENLINIYNIFDIYKNIDEPWCVNDNKCMNNIIAYFEYTFGNYITKKQLDICYDIYNSVSTDKQYFHHLIMGGGKSSVIVPLATLMLLSHDNINNVIIIVPPHLLNDTNQIIKNSCVYINNITIINFPQNDKKLSELKINSTNKKHIYISDSNTFKKKFLFNVNQKIINKYENTFIISDEIDLLCDPLKSELNFPINEDSMEKKQIFIDNNIKIGNIMLYILRVINNYCYENNSKIYNKSPHLYFFKKNDVWNSNITNTSTLFDILCDNNQIFDVLNETYHIADLNKDSLKKIINTHISMITDDNHKIINKIFDTISSCLTNLHLRNYGIPNDNNNFTAIPYIAVNTPSFGSEFSDIYFVIAYTILSLIGKQSDNHNYIINYIINKKEILIDDIQKILKIENIQNKHKLFNLLLKQPELYDVLRYNDFIIDKTIKNIITYKITLVKEEINCSYFDILSSSLCEKRTGFTGTPNMIEQIDIIDDKQIAPIQKNEDDIANISVSFTGVINNNKPDDIMKVPKTIPVNDSEDILIQIGNIINTLNYSTLIDTGSFLLKNSAYEVINHIRKTNINKKYFVYYNSKDIPMIIEKDESIFERQYYVGSVNLNELFIYFDNKHCTGTDTKLNLNALGLITIRQSSRFRDVAQGVFRMRNINKGQTINIAYLSSEFESELEITADYIYKILNDNEMVYYNNQKSNGALQLSRTLIRNQQNNAELYKINMENKMFDTTKMFIRDIQLTYRTIQPDTYNIIPKIQRLLHDIYNKDFTDIEMTHEQVNQQEQEQEAQQEQEVQQEKQIQKQIILNDKSFFNIKQLFEKQENYISNILLEQLNCNITLVSYVVIINNIVLFLVEKEFLYLLNFIMKYSFQDKNIVCYVNNNIIFYNNNINELNTYYSLCGMILCGTNIKQAEIINFLLYSNKYPNNDLLTLINKNKKKNADFYYFFIDLFFQYNNLDLFKEKLKDLIKILNKQIYQNYRISQIYEIDIQINNILYKYDIKTISDFNLYKNNFISFCTDLCKLTKK